MASENCDSLTAKCADITSEQAGEALCNAASDGTIEIVKLLLEMPTDILDVQAGKALRYAAEIGAIRDVEQLLEKRTEIPAKWAGEALAFAASRGHNEIIKCF